VLEKIVQQIPASKLDEKLSPDRFTLREAIAHQADWEPIFYGRLRQMLDTPGASIESRDEGQMAIDNNYAAKDVNECLARLKQDRAKTTAMLKALPPEDWDKFGNHWEIGHMTVYDLASMMQGHDMYHLQQASSYLS
jgi:hypothetical protein